MNCPFCFEVSLLFYFLFPHYDSQQINDVDYDFQLKNNLDFILLQCFAIKQRVWQLYDFIACEWVKENIKKIKRRKTEKQN